MEYSRSFVLILIVTITFSVSSFAQTPMAYRQPVPQRIVPAIVMESYQMQHGDALVLGWYSTHILYWQNDISAAWYTDWYGTERTIIIYTYEKPTYYEVEFIDHPGEISRAIFNLHGYWYETRTQIKGMPMACYDALNASKYAKWKMSKTMEKISNPAWPKDIYRFQVSKGLQSQIIRMEPDGTIIQAKLLEE